LKDAITQMPNVLQSWVEIGEATLKLQRQGLPTHSTTQKNWDLSLLYDVLCEEDRNLKIVDLGCGAGETLEFLAAMGFKNICGVDLLISMRLKLSRIAKMARRKTFVPPFSLKKGDITKTSLPDSRVDFAACISVIEHGVDVGGFLREAHRIIKPKGKLFITTDYWHDKIPVRGFEFGLPWEIFSLREINTLIDQANNIGFKLVPCSEVPVCIEKTINWHNAEYTFIQLLFEKN
jgi:SAM-dependent methyltransferase